MQTTSQKARIDRLRKAIEQRVGDQQQGRKIATVITTVEPLLVLARKYGNPSRADKAHLLISNYRLLDTRSFGPREHLLQMARRHLMSITSARNWQDMLQVYMGEVAENYRMFDIVDNKIVQRDKVFEGAGRETLYIEWLREPMPSTTSAQRAQANTRYTYWASPEREGRGVPLSPDEQLQGSMRDVIIPGSAPIRHMGTHAKTPPHKTTRPPISFELSELIEAAHEIGTLTGKRHLKGVLERAVTLNLFKRIIDGAAVPTGQIQIEHVTNLVGIVGAGKSVLANVLTYACAKRGLRVAIVHNSIADIMDSLEFFEQLNISVSPLTSRRDRLGHLDELSSKNGKMLLSDAHARYFETPCLIDGMAEHVETPASYETTPCFDLKDTKGKPHACPFIEICPSQAMARAALSSQIVITTPAGLVMITTGAERRPFFEHALADFDLVIFDEADRVQSQLDGLFAPSESFHEFIRDSADELARASKRPPSEKLLNANNEHVIGLRSRSETAATVLAASTLKPAIANWRELKDRAFTSLSLIELLRGHEGDKAEDRLPAELITDLEYCVSLHGDTGREDEQPITSLLLDAVHLACEDIDCGHFLRKLDEYFAQKGHTVSPILQERFAFVLKVICFDNLLRELDRSSAALSHRDPTMERLCNFLHASTSRQAPYLPASPVGNLCGFKITDDGDIELYRQFATGRVFMTALP